MLEVGNKGTAPPLLPLFQHESTLASLVWSLFCSDTLTSSCLSCHKDVLTGRYKLLLHILDMVIPYRCCCFGVDEI